MGQSENLLKSDNKKHIVLIYLINKECIRISFTNFLFSCRVKKECIKNSHPVIVTNTHMKKSEFQEYLNLAAEYEYTIIISSTLDKFEISPKV